ncbi:Histone-lysine N-methyltransferase EZH1 [Fragariocoptes setiger]|uniref:[histone H3]-lysine(27) N-trimethyltransferase n=1 Tax=Fragariocoptes setiger TaxID=1670756 RepID=A0ABQ7SAA5_9ACAR|nr:Histone-lysine N-methyltransferase EZH1 [Fragariocoptes setiger]
MRGTYELRPQEVKFEHEPPLSLLIKSATNGLLIKHARLMVKLLILATIVTFLLSGLVINFLQLINVIVVKRFSPRLARQINYLLMYSSWSQVVACFDWFCRSTFRITYEDASLEKNLFEDHSIFLANHSYELDWIGAWLVTDKLNQLASCKAMLKKNLKYVPVVGWTWAVSDQIFLDREWEKDKRNLNKSIDALLEYEPMVATFFCEGTRFTKDKLEESIKFAKERNLTAPRYHLIPRTKGFVAVIRHIRQRMRENPKLKVNIHDVQVAYEPDGAMNLGDIIDGKVANGHMYFKRYSINDIPEDDEGCAQWLRDLYIKKCLAVLENDEIVQRAITTTCDRMNRLVVDNYNPITKTVPSQFSASVYAHREPTWTKVEINLQVIVMPYIGQRPPITSWVPVQKNFYISNSEFENSSYFPRPNVDDVNSMVTTRQEALRTYTERFCRRCYMYNCYSHTPEPITKSRQVSLSTPNLDQSYFMNEWAGPETTLARVLDPMFSFASIAEILGTKTEADVEKLLDFENVLAISNCENILHQQPTRVKRRRNHARLSHVKRRHVAPGTHQISGPFPPCNHPNVACDRNCSCVQSGSTCEKHCYCSEDCRNRFAGCKCDKGCKSDTCPCFKSNRECDPDLCLACRPYPISASDQPLVTRQICCNMNMLLGKRKHLLMGISKISGWGVFTRFSLRKGEYISEYCGELVDQDLAERRGRVYDLVGSNWLFYLNRQYSIDAKRKGNKTRFMNHSTQANVLPKVLYYMQTLVSKMSKVYPPELKKYMDKQVAVKINGSRKVVGVVRGFDAFMNVVLDDCVEKSENNLVQI